MFKDTSTSRVAEDVLTVGQTLSILCQDFNSQISHRKYFYQSNKLLKNAVCLFIILLLVIVIIMMITIIVISYYRDNNITFALYLIIIMIILENIKQDQFFPYIKDLESQWKNKS